MHVLESAHHPHHCIPPLHTTTTYHYYIPPHRHLRTTYIPPPFARVFCAGARHAARARRVDQEADAAHRRLAQSGDARPALEAAHGGGEKQEEKSSGRGMGGVHVQRG
eukprot:2944002-Pleurochrysis_carterae.AAC.1